MAHDYETLKAEMEKAYPGYKFLDAEHIDGEPDGSGKTEKEKTKITLSRAIAAGSETIKIANTPSVYETLGMTEEELEAIKADLQQ